MLRLESVERHSAGLATLTLSSKGVETRSTPLLQYVLTPYCTYSRALSAHTTNRHTASTDALLSTYCTVLYTVL